MKVFFYYISDYGPKYWDINNPEDKIQEAIRIALKLKTEFHLNPYYFYFTDDNGQKIEEGRYYLNGRILNSRDIRNLDRQLYNYSISNNWNTIIEIGGKDQLKLYEPYFEDNDVNISI